jgi:hypothetical protein
MKQVEYRINRLAPRCYGVEVVWGLLDVMRLYAGKTWPTMGDARRAAQKHASDQAVSPMIVRGR